MRKIHGEFSWMNLTDSNDPVGSMKGIQGDPRYQEGIGTNRRKPIERTIRHDRLDTINYAGSIWYDQSEKVEME
jgi:hypothetical protein